MVFPRETSLQPGDCVHDRTNKLGRASNGSMQPTIGREPFDTRFHFTSCPRNHSLLAKNVLCHGKSRHGLWPTSIERKVRDDFLELCLSKTVVFRPHEMARKLLGVAACDQSGNGNQTPIALRELRSFPDVAKENIVRERY